MGSKQQPKKYLDSSKLTKPKRRTGREEFSDNELMSEDEQDYQDERDDQEDQQDEDTTNNLGRSHKPNTPSTSKRHDTGNYEVRGAQTFDRRAATVDDIAGPKTKKKVPPKSLAEQIFTSVFIYQLLITITSVLLVNFSSVYILNNSILVSDTSFRSNDKVIDIGEKVQKALNTEMDKADIGGKVRKALDTEMDKAGIGGKVQKTLDIEILDKAGIGGKVQKTLDTEMDKADIGGKVQKALEIEMVEANISGKIQKAVQDAIDIKLPDALNNQIPQIVRLIKTQVSENTERIKSDVEQLLSSRIANAFGISLDKEDATLEEAIGGIAESLSSFEQNLQNNFTSANNSLKQLSATSKNDSGKIDNLQTTVQDGKEKLKDMDTKLEELKKEVLDKNSLYEKYKEKVLQLDDIRSRIDVIQPNMFNKDSFIMAFMILIVMVFVLAVSVYNLYQRSNNDNLVRTGGRTTAKQRINLGNNEVLKMIPDGAELEAGVCIISFDESRTTTHRRILDSANIPNCRVQVHVVRRHEHIPELPRCKVYLMCTEFSERHVIIEEPGKGLGDLHKTTYDAVMKLGGCLIILYTRDPGSRNLKDQVRYNKNIYCVTSQPELSALNQDGRFFSLYDNLSHYQKSELRRKITENMT